jgi:hypothetical protein
MDMIEVKKKRMAHCGDYYTAEIAAYIIESHEKAVMLKRFIKLLDDREIKNGKQKHYNENDGHQCHKTETDTGVSGENIEEYVRRAKKRFFAFKQG